MSQLQSASAVDSGLPQQGHESCSLGDGLSPIYQDTKDEIRNQLARLPLPVLTLTAILALVPSGNAAVGDQAGHQHSNERLSTLQEPQPTLAAPRIEVIEFFWYGCPHCHQLEPAI